MNLDKRISAFVSLKEFFQNILNEDYIFDNEFSADADNFRNIILTDNFHNAWFTEANIKYSIRAISESLSEANIKQWLSKYNLKNENEKPSKVGVILAGNLPLVGFHDFLCVLITGNIFIGKMSSKDNRLLKSVADILKKIEPEFEKYIYFEENILKNFDAIIATGSNNSARYFEYYFGKYPNIIRKNRNSIAILEGSETKEHIEKLADDIFMYFGLGCRNVSKIFIPENFELNRIFEGLLKYSEIINHNKYVNNYAYNRAIYLMDSKVFFDNNFVMLKEDSGISSPISVVYFEHYKSINQMIDYVKSNSDLLQCVVTNMKLNDIKTINFGETQKPQLWDYADNIDTINYLISL